ncbi:MAG: GtrA family protein [bacterium]|nr:MAG: GtrA family protein [bacterium]
MKKFKSLFQYLKNDLLQLRILKFGLVGMTGVGVNMGMLYILTEYLHIIYIISSLIAIEISILSNFFLNDLWTWGDRVKKSFWERFIQYHISVGLTAILANWLILLLLTEFFGIYYLISNLIGIAVGTLSNYILNDLWTFKQKSMP